LALIITICYTLLMSKTALTELSPYIKDKNPGGFGKAPYSGEKTFASFSPNDNSKIAEVSICSKEDYDKIVNEAHMTFLEWRKVPAPKRGLLVRDIADALRTHKKSLGKLIGLETGKILPEAEGEVQEAIDIADFAVGLSRQLYGLSMHSERPSHRMSEQWHPLGVVGCISAFNFPVAVWAWNSMLAAVCGDTIVWKPSELAPISAIAVNNICREISAKHGFPGLFCLTIGDGPELGRLLAEDRRIPLVSATGSCRMGKSVGETVGKRLGKTILELGGNNAAIVLDDADLKTAVPSIVFGAVGTAGQRCTSLRRLYVDKKIEKELLTALTNAYKQVRIGNPAEDRTLMGPLINKKAVESYLSAVNTAKKEGAEIIYGGEVVKDMPSDLYVKPTIIKAKKDTKIVEEETFAPILYVISVESLEEGISENNKVPQGLSSSVYTNSVKASEYFLSAAGSDCGIANVNIGTSGAEIGGAFGGEKETGGGRESGSDSWKQYMRRQTNTVNYGNDLPLAQGIKFDYD
jgi:aldehyde dehydrogenase (NAD+)